MFDTERKELIFVFIATFLIGFFVFGIVFIPVGWGIGIPFGATVSGSVMCGFFLSISTLLFR